jgi:hypothetical protein
VGGAGRYAWAGGTEYAAGRYLGGCGGAGCGGALTGSACGIGRVGETGAACCWPGGFAPGTTTRPTERGAPPGDTGVPAGGETGLTTGGEP